jgi:hypothetical protein
MRGQDQRSTGRATAFVARASFHSGPVAARCRTPVSFTLGLKPETLASATAILLHRSPLLQGGGVLLRTDQRLAKAT